MPRLSGRHQGPGIAGVYRPAFITKARAPRVIARGIKGSERRPITNGARGRGAGGGDRGSTRPAVEARCILWTCEAQRQHHVATSFHLLAASSYAVSFAIYGASKPPRFAKNNAPWPRARSRGPNTTLSRRWVYALFVCHANATLDDLTARAHAQHDRGAAERRRRPGFGPHEGVGHCAGKSRDSRAVHHINYPYPPATARNRGRAAPGARDDLK